jgi:hypothetical protein
VVLNFSTFSLTVLILPAISCISASESRAMTRLALVESVIWCALCDTSSMAAVDAVLVSNTCAVMRS